MNKRLLCAGCLTFWGVLLFIGGWVANYAILKTVANTLNSGVKTSTDTSSDSYLNFVDSSRPDVAITYWDYYLFNTTNYNDVSLNGALPILKEVGPYSFIETAKKYPSTTTEDGSATATPGLTFNADKSEASWISWSTFKFNAATSGAGLTEDDIVITPSPLTNALQNANEGLEENFFPYVTPFLFALYSIIRPTPWTPAFPPSLATTASFISEVGMYMAWGTTMNYTLDHPDAPRPNITTYLATRNAVAASAAAGNIELSKPGKNVNLPSDYYNFLRYCKLATPGDILGNYYAGVTTPFCDYTQDQPGFDAAIWPTYGISNETMSKILFQGHYPLWYGLTATKQGVCYLDADETQICAASLFQPTAKNVYALGGPNTEYNLTSNQITGLQLFSMAWSFALHQHALDRAGYHIHPVTVTDDPSPTAGTYTTPRGARRWRILSATKTVRGGEQDKVAQVLNPLGYRGVGLFSNYPSLKQAMQADEYQTINTGQVDFSLNDRIKQTQKLENIKWCNSKQVNVFSSGAKFTPQMPPGKQEGLKFVPTLTKDSIVPLWSDEIGRSVEMAFDKESSVKGVSTYRFKIASYMLTPNATRNDGTTFTNRELFGVTLEGVADMSCYSSLKTAHASQPRFYGTPESQRTKYAGLSGMQAPDPNVYVNLEMEPNTGAAIAGRLALQTSLRIDLKSPYYCLNSTSLGEPAFYYCKHNFQGWPTSTNIGSINPGFADDLSNNKPFYMHPIMYVLKHSELTDKQADTLKSSLLRAIDASLIILVVLTIVGGVLAITGLILLIQTRSAGKTSGGDGMRLD